MQVKSYILENDTKKLSNYNSILFYGVNLGLKKHFKESLKALHNKDLILNYDQEDLIKSEEKLINEISMSSLFQEQKLIFIDNVTDKLLNTLEKIINIIGKNKIIIFSEMLEKRSKIRDFYEKSKNLISVPCYEDNEITIKKIITTKLKDFNGLTSQNINLIADNCGVDRVKLNNELIKIYTYFQNKTLETDKLELLLNLKVNEDFNLLKDEAILGNRSRTNKLLSDTILESEKILLYVNIINQRLNRMYFVIKNSELSNLDEAIKKLKPPIFWKDKSTFLTQIKKWDTFKIRKILKKSYELEIRIKSNYSINKDVLIKKFLVDICNLANA